MQHTASIVVFVIAVVFGLLALLFKLGGKEAMKRPVVHDGIGGKDTDNLATGCFGLMAYFFLGWSSIVLLVAAVLVFAIGY